MNEGKSENIMAEFNNVNGSERRRSARLSSPPQANVKTDNKMALDPVAVKRRITVRKIAPRKTVAPSEHDKENTPKRSELDVIQQKKPKVSTPGSVPGRGRSSSAKKPRQSEPDVIQQKKPEVSTPGSAPGRGRSSSAKKPRRSEPDVIQQKKPEVSTPGSVPSRGRSSSATKQKKAAMPSPILPSSPPPSSRTQQPAVDPEDAVWSQKVRRSYSRLSDKSLNSPDSRETLFGFEKLQTPEVIRRVAQPKTGLEVSGSLSGLNSFTSLLEADDCGGSAFPEPDTNIPGVAVVKEKRRKKKVQQIDATELDAMAAKMNAEFDEAEGFELVVE